MKTNKEMRPFGMRDKVAYALGDFGCNMSFALKGTVQTFWLVYMMMETGWLSILLSPSQRQSCPLRLLLQVVRCCMWSAMR